MRLSRQLTLNQALEAIGEAGFDMRFRILWSHKKWAVVFVRQTEQFDGTACPIRGPHFCDRSAHSDGSGGDDGRA